MNTNLFRGVILFSLLIAGGSGLLFAQKWQPYQFERSEKYEYQIISHENKVENQAYYALQVRDTGSKNAQGDDLFEVSYTTRGNIPKSELGAQTAFGIWSFYGVSLSLAFFNPAYAMFFTQMDLKVGEKMSFFGAGLMEMIGKETIAGREGYLCQYYQTRGEEKVLTSEWVIDPALALPIKSIYYEDGHPKSTALLIGYSQL